MSGVTFGREDGVLLVSIDRPEAANAIDEAVGTALCHAFAEAAAPGTDALVLTGAGSRVFSAGADMKSGADLPPLARAQMRSATLSALLNAVLGFPKPYVAAVNGAAAGAGVMLALLADAVFAAEGARFTMPEIGHGMPTPIGLAILADVGGSTLAADLVLSGRSMTAAEAVGRGLLRVVPPEQLRGAALDAARSLARQPALAFAQNKDWLQRGRRQAIAEATRDAAAYRARSLAAAGS